MSDLHLEHRKAQIEMPSGEILVLAGDITVAELLDPAHDRPHPQRVRQRTLDFFDQASSNFDQVIYLAGNHEHYRGELTETHANLQRHLDKPNIQLVDNDVVELGDVAILFTTLWSDMDRGDPRTLHRVDRDIPDFSSIEFNGERFTSQHAADLHQEALRWLRAELPKRETQTTIVVTHHAPSRRGLDRAFEGDGLNGGYASNLEGLIKEHPHIHTWIFGHTHVCTTFAVGRTLCRSNAAGYRAAEAHGFDPDMSFDV